jgi:hypothetical protein
MFVPCLEMFRRAAAKLRIIIAWSFSPVSFALRVCGPSYPPYYFHSAKRLRCWTGLCVCVFVVVFVSLNQRPNSKSTLTGHVIFVWTGSLHAKLGWPRRSACVLNCLSRWPELVGLVLQPLFGLNLVLTFPLVSVERANVAHSVTVTVCIS